MMKRCTSRQGCPAADHPLRIELASEAVAEVTLVCHADALALRDGIVRCNNCKEEKMSRVLLA